MDFPGVLGRRQGLRRSQRRLAFSNMSTVDVATFKAHDERRLIEDYKHFTDVEKLQERARSDAARLEKLFEEDSADAALDEAKGAGPAKGAKKARA